MKFDCGETWNERKVRLSNWHKFFAIFPRRVGIHDCRWMETIERKGKLQGSWDGVDWYWEYRALKG